MQTRKSGYLVAKFGWGPFGRGSVRDDDEQVQAAREGLGEETNPLAIKHLEISLENARMACDGCGLVRGDTGFPLFFVKAGSRTRVEGGFGRLWDAAQAATARVTGDNFMRPTMVDPLTRANPDELGKTEASWIFNCDASARIISAAEPRS